MGDRALRWDGCRNVRDLGGYPTQDGGTTRFGAVVRADSLRGLSDAGWIALVAYGIRTIVDLRWREELHDDRPSDVPVDLLHISLLGERGDFGEVDRLVRRIKDPLARKQTAYLEFLARFSANFARAVTAVADATAGGVAVYCAGGVDRAGLVSALLLRLAGVPPEQVAADYAVSEVNWAPFVGEWIAEAENEEEREHRRLLALCPPEAMLGVLVELERRHGGVEGYLLAGGATESVLDAARRRLRG
jgi:protein-tyrosine phosphatase